MLASTRASDADKAAREDRILRPNRNEKRFEKHKQGLAAKYTRAHKPVKVVYTSEFDTKSEAMKEECRIKKLPRYKKLELINNK